ncbi:hypothetical protein B0A55_12270, partial [Friedmanniomyces simplex]
MKADLGIGATTVSLEVTAVADAAGRTTETAAAGLHRLEEVLEPLAQRAVTVGALDGAGCAEVEGHQPMSGGLKAGMGGSDAN